MITNGTPEIIDITGYPLIALEKSEDDQYPYPRIRYGILPYYITPLGQIVWGCIESNRVEPITLAPAAGTQDIIAIKNNQRLVLELGKPLPDLGCEFNFLHKFIGHRFRDEAYQAIITCLVENDFNVYLENPLATAIHEAYEEHGIDFHKTTGHDNQWLKGPLESTQYQLILPQTGVTAPLGLWLPELTSIDGVVLRYTEKIDNKMRRNAGREFYEKGTWVTMEEFKTKFGQEKERFSSLEGYPSVKIELITEAFCAYKLHMQVLGRIERELYHEQQSISNNPHAFFNPVERDNDEEADISVAEMAASVFGKRFNRHGRGVVY